MARRQDLRDETLPVARGGKVNQRHGDDKRVGWCQSPALGESDPCQGRDRLIAVPRREQNRPDLRGVIITVSRGAPNNQGGGDEQRVGCHMSPALRERDPHADRERLTAALPRSAVSWSDYYYRRYDARWCCLLLL